MDVLKFWWTQRRMRRMARGLVSTEVEVLTSLGTTLSLKICSSVEVNKGPFCASHTCPSKGKSAGLATTVPDKILPNKKC